MSRLTYRLRGFIQYFRIQSFTGFIQVLMNRTEQRLWQWQPVDLANCFFQFDRGSRFQAETKLCLELLGIDVTH
ncbi:group II intron maturase-specific domain-containing protein [Paenibacillus urinalis]|uniref:group II intron maturase-specific domain-containing protein n=1 Tax=Paenibacillus urinalis TaxID=521520 RepID=UPI00363904AC